MTSIDITLLPLSIFLKKMKERFNDDKLKCYCGLNQTCAHHSAKVLSMSDVMRLIIEVAEEAITEVKEKGL